MSKIIRPIAPNAGVAAYYRKRLQKELKAMHKCIVYWIGAAYRRNETEIVGDASIFGDIFSRFRTEMRHWFSRWNILSSWLGERVVERTNRTTTSSLKEAFKAAGFTVKMDPTRLGNAKTKALIAENVSLIKSIPEKYLTDVEGIITRGVSMGRDMEYIARELGKRYEISNRRCRIIARDQVDKATQVIQRVHDEKIGITEGIWIHMPGRYTRRKTHIAMNGKRFKLFGPDAGLYDSDVGKRVLPGECVLCRCRYSRVIPEFGDNDNE